MVVQDGEVNLKKDPYHGKILIPPVRNQLKTSTCFIQSSCTSRESLSKREGALANPPQDFEVILSAEHLREMYEQEHGIIGEEPTGKRGFRRLLNVLEILKTRGVIGLEKMVPVGPFKVESFEEIDVVHQPKSSKACPNPPPKVAKCAMNLLRRGHCMVGTFKISKNYRKLKPGDIYTYDPPSQVLNNERAVSHAVAIIGYGLRDGVWYYVFQNSHGETWGEKGIGRVNVKSLTHLVHMTL